MTLTTTKNNIIFRFLDPVNTKGEFVRAKTSFGLEFLSGFENSAKQPRWVTVLAIGPEVKYVNVGDIILLPALRWTERVEFEGERFWKTNESEVVAVKYGQDLEALNSFILFIPTAPSQSTTSSGLIVVGALTDATPTGQVFEYGPDVSDSLASKTIYFNGDLFNDKVTTDNHWPQEFWFIKEENVLCYSE
jgi:co-chaperonin GroES (HSP10)